MSQLLMIASGKGGVGKSATAVFLGRALAFLEKSVLLVETGAGLRGLDFVLSLQKRVVFDLADVLDGGCPPEQAVVADSHQGNLHLIAAPANPGFVASQAALGDFLALCRRHYDHVIIDTPAGLGADLTLPAPFCDAALLVTTPDAVSVRGTASASAALWQAGLQNQRLVINQVPRMLMRSGTIGDLDDVIDGTGVQLIGLVPEDQGVKAATAAAAPLGRCPAKVAFDNIAARVCGRYVELMQF